MKIYKPGDKVYVGRDQATIVRQVLRARPAYRVRFAKRTSYGPQTAVIDGVWISDEPLDNMFETLNESASRKTSLGPNVH
jgi:hypothetical protein